MASLFQSKRVEFTGKLRLEVEYPPYETTPGGFVLESSIEWESLYVWDILTNWIEVQCLLSPEEGWVLFYGAPIGEDSEAVLRKIRS